MRQILLIYVVLFALLPFIRAFRCGTQTNITFVPDVAEALAQYGGFNESTTGLWQRGTNVFDIGQYQPYPNLRQPWPVWVRRNGEKVRVVQYCYDNEATREQLDCVVKHAILRWMNKLSFGEFKGKTNLQFREYQDKAQMWHYCYDDQQNWNSRYVLKDALRIHIGPNTGFDEAASSAGYEVDPSNREGRHELIIPSFNRDNPAEYADKVNAVTHEIAHVLGMDHEHSRSDRDDRLFFNCRNVAGFDVAFSNAQNMNHGLTADEVVHKLCTDFQFAGTYGFSTEAWRKFDARSLADELYPTDLDSITIYASNAGSRAECHPGNVNACALAKYAVVNGIIDKSAPLQYIYRNRRPSDGDARFVARWYPME